MRALRWLALCCFALATSVSGAEPGDPPRAETPLVPARGERYRTPIRDRSDYWQGFAALGLGKGLRFNNPYRLATPLGDSPESASLSATYYDLGLGFVRGPSDGIAHGAVIHLSLAAQGIPQAVTSLSYTGLYRVAGGRVLLFGRAGVPIVLSPDLSGGLELGAAAAYLVTAGLGVQSELVGSLFYGAGTRERSVTVIPILSAQLSVFVHYEVLP